MSSEFYAACEIHRSAVVARNERMSKLRKEAWYALGAGPVPMSFVDFYVRRLSAADTRHNEEVAAALAEVVRLAPRPRPPDEW
jgi:hypothetical protein